MTMHASKGLEYPIVYIVDANEEITPHKEGGKLPRKSRKSGGSFMWP